MQDSTSPAVVSCETHPDRYHHWHLTFDGAVASLVMDVREDAGLRSDYRLKLNSYDLSVDIELADAIERIRFEHPEVRAVIVKSARDRMFSAGANIFMLAGSSHDFKVNFCKFTNETRLAMEDASARSGIKFITAVNGVCAGGGYELALACDEICMVDDGNAAVSLPEVPLLGVLPGTGGLTRLTDKRKVRRDLADFFCTHAEGLKGRRAVEGDSSTRSSPPAASAEAVRQRADELAAGSDRPEQAAGITLGPLDGVVDDDGAKYSHVTLAIDRARRTASLTVRAPREAQPETVDAIVAAGQTYWPLAAFQRAGRRAPAPAIQRAGNRHRPRAHRRGRGAGARRSIARSSRTRITGSCARSSCS